MTELPGAGRHRRADPASTPHGALGPRDTDARDTDARDTDARDTDARDTDAAHANGARMYDYMLGGVQNFAVDRERVDDVRRANPAVVEAAWANRTFLWRVVAWCIARGVDQFLDLGSGVPTVGNVHEIAHRADPTAKVAYVDVEPAAVAHATRLLAGIDGATITRADVRDPAGVLSASGVAGFLDFDRPVALLAISVLHFVAADLDPLLRGYRRVLAPGSVVAISHTSDEHEDPTVQAATRAASAAYEHSATPVTLRSRAELLRLFVGLDVVEPGLVPVNQWPHQTPDPPCAVYAGVAVVPRPPST